MNSTEMYYFVQVACTSSVILNNIFQINKKDPKLEILIWDYFYSSSRIYFCSSLASCNFNSSKISRNNKTSSSVSSSSLSTNAPKVTLFTILTNMNTAKPIIKKSIIDCMNTPYVTPFHCQEDAKSVSPNNSPINGIMILPTNESTILPNAAPITTATARSNTFPRIINSLNSLIIFSPHNNIFLLYTKNTLWAI